VARIYSNQNKPVKLFSGKQSDRLSGGRILIAMTDTHSSAPYGLIDDTWDNAKTLTQAAMIRLGSPAHKGVRQLLRYAEDMVRRLIMLMAEGLKLSGATPKALRPIKRSGIDRELALLIAEVGAALRDAPTKDRASKSAPKRPQPPQFQWRLPERAPVFQNSKTPPTTDELRAPTSDPMRALTRRLDALLDAVANPKPYARKAAVWLAQQSEVDAPHKAPQTAPVPGSEAWDNALIRYAVQMRAHPPAIDDSS